MGRGNFTYEWDQTFSVLTEKHKTHVPIRAMLIVVSQLCTYVLESGGKCRNGQENQREESVDVNAKVMRPGRRDLCQFNRIRLNFGQVPWLFLLDFSVTFGNFFLFRFNHVGESGRVNIFNHYFRLVYSLSNLTFWLVFGGVKILLLDSLKVHKI